MFLGAAGGLLAASVVVLVWMHVAYFNLTATPYDLIVLGQRDLLAATNGSVRIVLRDHASLAPIANVPVKVQSIGASGKTADLAAFTTDAHGGGEPRLHVARLARRRIRPARRRPDSRAPETSVQKVSLKRRSR